MFLKLLCKLQHLSILLQTLIGSRATVKIFNIAKKGACYLYLLCNVPFKYSVGTGSFGNNEDDVKIKKIEIKRNKNVSEKDF